MTISGAHGRVSRVAVATAHCGRPVTGRAFGNPGRPRSELRRRCNTFTNFVQPGSFNHSQLRCRSQPAKWYRHRACARASSGGPAAGPAAQCLHAGREAGAGRARPRCARPRRPCRRRPARAAAGPAARPACSLASCSAPVSGTRHRHAEHQGRIDLAQAEQPEAAVLGHPEGGVRGAGHQRLGGRGQQGGRHLRGVHPDQDQRSRAGRPGVGQGPGDALVEAAAALADDVEAGRQPAARASRPGRAPGGPRWLTPPRPGCRPGPPRRARPPPRGCTAASGGS